MLPLSLLAFGAALIARYGRETVALRIYGVPLLAIAIYAAIRLALRRGSLGGCFRNDGRARDAPRGRADGTNGPSPRPRRCIARSTSGARPA
jgi:hypothetical protein